MQMFVDQGLQKVIDDPRILTLKGRLLKDRAKMSAGRDSVRYFGEAADAYLAAYELERASYPLVNAAACFLFAEDRPRSRELAREGLAMLEANPAEGETPFWHLATIVENLLLLEEFTRARKVMAEACALQCKAYEDQAATIGQCERILRMIGEDPGWLDEFRPPRSLHFSGLIGLDENDIELRNAIRAFFEREQPGFAFGALAAGADILIAEAARESGAELHVILPDDLNSFRASSVEPSGGHWLSRFDALIEQAVVVESVPLNLEGADAAMPQRIELASLVAMGLCQRHAGNLCSDAFALTIAAAGEPARAYLDHWKASGLPLERIETARAMHSQVGGDSIEDDRLLSLIGVEGVMPGNLADLARRFRMVAVPETDPQIMMGSPQDTLSFAKECLGYTARIRASLVLGVVVQERLETLIEQVGLISEVREFGGMLMDRGMAMAATLFDRDLQVEEIGEIASLSGPISIWTGRVHSKT